MSIVQTIFGIEEVAFTILNYPMSYVELIGTIFGIWCVWLTAKEKVSSWPIGIVNIVFFFILFYQVRLYSDMFLQVVFLVISIYGWYKWTHPKTKKMENKRKELKITLLSKQQRILTAVVIAVCTLALYLFMSRIHIYLPFLFPEAALAPLRDAFTTVASIVAITIMARKKLECWVLWIAVDIVAFIYYFQVGIILVGIEYILFLIIATKGLFNWVRYYKDGRTYNRVI